MAGLREFLVNGAVAFIVIAVYDALHLWSRAPVRSWSDVRTAAMLAAVAILLLVVTR